MPTLHLLGTGAALSDARRTTTMLAFETRGSTIVVDCGDDVVQRLLAGGVVLDEIEAMIITHEHPDHVGGFPLFMERIWLAGRRRPIDVFGPAAGLSQARRVFEAFDTSGWEGMPEIRWHEVPLKSGARVLENERWRITAAPGEHSVPVIGVRVEDRHEGGTVAYSADTRPAAAITALATDADILVHEASGEYAGHTTMSGAARVAREANAGRLVLVHLPPDASEAELSAPREIFPATELGYDGQTIDF